MDLKTPWTLAMWAYMALIPITALALRFVVAPYGRHRRQGWGPTLDTRLAWMVWESPAVVAFLAFYVLGERAWQPVPLLMLGLWMAHYVHRTFIYPLRIRAGSDHRTPWLIVLSAVFYNLLNAFVNASWLSSVGPAFGTSWLKSARFLVGLAIFAAGWVANRHSDRILRNLRKPGEEGYLVPTGGLFRWVSCPNYLGEMTTWLGWAILTWSPAGLLFLLYTLANLGPRALANHRWYRTRFPDYPRERKALIPFVL